MRRWLLSSLALLYVGSLALVFSSIGCEPPRPVQQPTPKLISFHVTLTVAKVNGLVKQITVNMPGDNPVLKNREDADLFIKTLEVLTADLKTISEQMEIVEPRPKPVPPSKLPEKKGP